MNAMRTHILLNPPNNVYFNFTIVISTVVIVVRRKIEENNCMGNVIVPTRDPVGTKIHKRQFYRRGNIENKCKYLHDKKVTYVSSYALE